MKPTALLLTSTLLIAQCTQGDIGHTLPCQYTPPNGNDNHIKKARYQGILEKYNKLGLPGISLLVRDRRGMYVAATGKADIEKNIDFRPCTVAKVASITKMFTGVLLHKLVEENQINLDDKVDAWLDPDILEKVRNCRGATIRQLMNHTTGIYDIISSSAFYLSLLNNPDKKWTGEELIKFAYSKTPKF
jgi:D-alanyl-D-alanine carboxypeptidase